MNPTDVKQTLHDTDGEGGLRDEISLLDFFNLILLHYRMLLGLPVLFAVLFVGLTVVQKRVYSARAAFVPQSSEGPLTRASGFAAQFGFALPGGQPGESPEFYAELIESDPVLRRTVLSEYPFEGRDSVDLVEVFGLDGQNRELDIAKAVRRLHRMLAVRTNRISGIVAVEITGEWQTLVASIADNLMQLVNEFNLETRQTRAAAERRFVEDRVNQANEDLRATEDKLQVFLSQNREFRSSPQLSFQHDRLSREVNNRQQIYTSLAQAFEEARIDEVRTTPVITVLERPRTPAAPRGRGLIVKAVLGGLAGAAVALAIVAMRALLLAGRARDPDAFGRMYILAGRMASDLRISQAVSKSVESGD